MFIKQITVNPESDDAYALDVNVSNRKHVKNAINQWYESGLTLKSNTLLIRFYTEKGGISLRFCLPLQGEERQGEERLSIVFDYSLLYKKAIHVDYQSLADLHLLLHQCYSHSETEVLAINFPFYTPSSRIIYGISCFCLAYFIVGFTMAIFSHRLDFYYFSSAPVTINSIVNKSLDLFWTLIVCCGIIRCVLLPISLGGFLERVKGVKPKLVIFGVLPMVFMSLVFVKLGYISHGYSYFHSKQSTVGTIEVTFTKRGNSKKHCSGSFGVEEFTSDLCIKDYSVLTKIKAGDKAILVGTVSPYAMKISKVLIPKYGYDVEF